MPLDVTSQTVIRRPRSDVAGFSADPRNAPSWYQNITEVTGAESGPLAVGSEITFAARFLGRRLAYTYVVREYAPGERLVMSTDAAPFPMETSYAWEDAGAGATRMTLRNRGGPTGLARAATPAIAVAVRLATRKDLARLKELLERAEAPG